MAETIVNSACKLEPQAGKLTQFRKTIVDDLKNRRFQVLLSKSSVGFGMILAIIPLLIIRVIRPLVVIRFAGMNSDRISPYVTAPEIYLSELESGLHGPKGIDIFYNRRYVCNQQVNRMWKRTLTITPLSEPLDRLNRLLPGGKAHEVPWDPNRKARDTYGVLDNYEPHVSFTDEEIWYGKSGLQELGIPDDARYVCFHARDSSYMATTFTTGMVNESSYRNSRIENYISAAEALTELGYYAVRMGSVVERPLTTNNPMIIDYASLGRTEFMDIFLMATCQFFLGSNAGIYGIAEWFRRPVIHVNFVPIELFYASNAHDLTILKRLWLRSENRYLTYHEILQSRLADARQNSQYEVAGVEVVDNTPEEITAVAIEMEQRIGGTWIEREEDVELQKQFWSLWGARQGPYRAGPGLGSWSNGLYRARVGTEFLRNNRELLVRDDSTTNTFKN